MTPLVLAALFVPPDAGLPPLTDLQRFPPLAVANARIRALIEQRHSITIRQAWEPRRRDFWQAALDANTHTLTAWEWMLVAQGGTREEHTTDTDCRRALARLREQVGARAYVFGHMP
jgi:hypothetical protein